MSKDAVTVRHYSLPSPHEIYQPAGEGPFPAVCLTPLLGRFVLLEDLFFERIFARYFAAHGILTILMDRPIFTYDPAYPLEQLHQYLETSLERNRRILEFQKQESPLDLSRLGTFGMSFGAILNSLWAAREPAFSAHIFALPGGDLPAIFTESGDPLMRSHFTAARRHTGLSAQALREKLRTVFKLDPMSCCGNLDSRSILMVLALFDRVVPFRLGRALQKVMGNPETIYLFSGHYGGVVTIPWLRATAVRFFRHRWGISES